MNGSKIEELKRTAAEVRKDILRMVGVARSGPFETSVSAADLLVYLYWEELLTDSAAPFAPERDRFITDAPDAVPALYAVLARRGFFEREHLWRYRRLGALLQALPDYGRTPGIDAPCFIVQPAVAAAAAVAEHLKSRGKEQRVIFLTEAERLSVKSVVSEYESAPRRGLSNFVALLLFRGGKGAVASEGKISSLLSSFGWDVQSAECRDFSSLEEAFARFRESGRPHALIAIAAEETGLSIAEPQKLPPQRKISMGELDSALEELEVNADAG